jgi:hypothetical protein
MARIRGGQGARPEQDGLSPGERAARDEARLAHAQNVLRMSRLTFCTAVAVMLLLIYTFIHADRKSASFYVSIVVCVLDAAFIAFNIFTAIRYSGLQKRLSGGESG